MDQNQGEPMPEMDKKEHKAFSKEVMSTVEACLEEKYPTKAEYINALVAKLEALKGEDGPAMMGGMGSEGEEPMELGSADEEA